MEWIKVTKANSLDGFLLEKTGMAVEEAVRVKPGHEYKIDGLTDAAGFLKRAKALGKTVTIVADYDADGVTSALIMAMLCIASGIHFELIMPKRLSEGYGLSDKIVGRICHENMLVTIDNGIKAVEQIQKAREWGMEVLILDHHQSGDTLPPANILIDPEATGKADFTHYCGAGLAFKLAELMLGENHPVIPVMASFAALGTIGDCVPLLGDNRRIVLQGMEALKSGKSTMAANCLWDRCRMGQSSSAMDIAFHMVPVLNAPGRLYDNGAQIAVSALFKNRWKEGDDAVIDNLVSINQERKDLVASLMEGIDIDAMVSSTGNGIVYYNPAVPVGIVGIIAGNISEKTNRPSVVFTDKDGKLKGSARNPDPSVNLAEVLGGMEDLLLEWGGHEGAAGLAIKPDDLAAFTERFCSLLPSPKPILGILFDLDIPEEKFIQMAEEILALEPCGQGLPAPKVKVRAKIERGYGSTGIMRIGKDKDHLKVTCNGFDILAFRQAEKLVPDKQEIEAVGRVSENIYNGTRTIQLVADDIRFL